MMTTRRHHRLAVCSAAVRRRRGFTREGSAFGHGGSAFTLVELMISIALVLILVVGINQVFKVTSQTVGTGQVASAALRDQRATTVTMQQDFGAALTSQSPFFVIHSEATPAFRNHADEIGAVQYGTDKSAGGATKATLNKDILQLDLNGNGKEGETTVPGEIISPVTYNDRNHRLDAVTFLARGHFQRQTGNPGAFTSPTNSDEAMVTYAHSLVRNNMVNPPAGTRVFYLPGEADQSPTLAPINRNDNNKYASQFVLGRSVMLLVPNIPTLGGGPEPRNYDVIGSPAANQVDLCPLSMDTYNTPQSGGTNAFYPSGDVFRIFWSRYDQAQTSIVDFGAAFASFLRAFPGPPTSTYTELDQWYRMPQVAEYNGTTNTTHFDTTTANAPNIIRPRLMYRSFVNPRPATPLIDVGAAQTVPYFLGHCSQFIVEFAGDFVRQDNDPLSGTYGNIVDDQPDGEIDYILVPSGGGAFIKQTRWYGMPRDTGTDPAAPSGILHLNDPDGAIYAPYGTNAALPSNRLVDVLPVRDIIRAGANDTITNAAFTTAHTAFQGRMSTTGILADTCPVEHNLDNTSSVGLALPFSHVPPPTNTGDYAATTGTDHTNLVNTANAGVLDYSAAWNFGGPKMIRITATIDDPAGRLPNGQTFQAVFTLHP